LSIAIPSFRIGVVVGWAVNISGQRVRIVALTVALLALGVCVSFMGPAVTTRVGGALQTCETFHPAREWAAATIAIYVVYAQRLAKHGRRVGAKGSVLKRRDSPCARGRLSVVAMVSNN
jgi:hypothetical protein